MHTKVSRPLTLSHAHARARAAVILGAAALCAPAGARAQQEPNCDSPEHRRGRQLRDAHRDDEALAVFQGIYERDHSACARARTGLALRALGRWAEADVAIGEALAQSADPWVVRARANMEAEREQIRQHLGEFDVRLATPVPGAELWVNGQRVGELPRPSTLWVSGGSTVIEVRAPGHETLRRTVQVSAGQYNRESVTLVPAAPAPAPVAAVERPPVTPDRAPPPREVLVVREERAGPGVGPWALVGVGTTLLVTSVVTFGLFLGDCDLRGREAACGDVGRSDVMQTVSPIALGLGLGLVGGGLLWWGLASPRSRERAAVSFDLGPTASGVTGAVRWSL